MSSTSTPSRTISFDSPEQEVFLQLWRTYDRLRILETDLFQQHDLTAQQYNVLRLLRAEYPEPLPTLQLAGRLITRAPDITRMIDKLEERKLVKREPHPSNRRVVRIALTQAGLDLLDVLDEPVRDCARKQVGHLSHEQQQQLIALLRDARRPHESADPAS